MNAFENEQVVRMLFPLNGKGNIPIDHGSALYGSISNAVAELHGSEVIGISPVEGGYPEGNTLRLNNSGYFYIQVPAANIYLTLRLAGKSLVIRDQMFRVGVPRLTMITPSSDLYARQVTVKGKMNELEVKTHIENIVREGTNLSLETPIGIKILRRRIITIHSKKVVTYEVKLSKLSPEVSVWLQGCAPLGRKRYGCSFFVPYSERG